MDMQTFTEKSRAALGEAQTLALRHGHQEVDAEHLAVALAVQEQGLVPRILKNLGVDATAYADAASAELRKRPSVSGPGVGGQMALSRRLGNVLIRARDFSRSLKDDFVSVEHLFHALLEESGGAGLGEINRSFKLSTDKWLKAMAEVRDRLGEPGAAVRAAAIALEVLDISIQKYALVSFQLKNEVNDV